MFKKNLDEYSLRELWKKLDEIEKARSWLLKYLCERMAKEVERAFQKFNQMNSQIQIKSFFVRYSTYFLLPFPRIMRRFEVIVTEISYSGKTIKMEEGNGLLLPALANIPEYWEKKVEEFLDKELGGKRRTYLEYLPNVYLCRYPERFGSIIYQTLRCEKEVPCWYISSEIQSVSSGFLFLAC